MYSNLFVPMLAAVAVTGKDVWLVVLAVIAGVGLMAIAKKAKMTLVKWRETALEISTFCTEVGMPHFAAFFNGFAVDDEDSMMSNAKTIITIIRSPSLRTAALAKMIDTYIGDALQNDPQEVARMQSLLAGTAAQAFAAANAPMSQNDINGIIQTVSGAVGKAHAAGAAAAASGAAAANGVAAPAAPAAATLQSTHTLTSTAAAGPATAAATTAPAA